MKTKEAEDDRQMDLDEFLVACHMLATRLEVSLLHIATPRPDWDSLRPSADNSEDEAEALEEAKKTEVAFPMHKAAAEGDIQRFEARFKEGSAAEERAKDQASGQGRDLPYLVFKYIKRYKDQQLRVGGKLMKLPAPPPWAQSSHNMGLVNCYDAGGWTCLHHAAARGHLRMVARLARLRFEVSRPNVKWSRSPLHLAVARNDPDMVRLLVQLGADWSTIDIGGATPLSSATEALLSTAKSPSLLLGTDCQVLPPPALPPPRPATKGFIDDAPPVPSGSDKEEEGAMVAAGTAMVAARETIAVWKLQPILVARPHRTRVLMLGAPHLGDLEFPWHAHKRTANTDSQAEVITREFDAGHGAKPDPTVNNASTNFGRDPPSTVRDFRNWTRLAEAGAMGIAGTTPLLGGRAHLSRDDMLQAIRTLFRRDASTLDVFYLVYSGHAQRLAGRWVAKDGFVSFAEVMGLWTAARQRAALGGVGPGRTSRLVVFVDAPHAGVWARSLRLLTLHPSERPPAWSLGAWSQHPYSLNAPEWLGGRPPPIMPRRAAPSRSPSASRPSTLSRTTPRGPTTATSRHSADSRGPTAGEKEERSGVKTSGAESGVETAGGGSSRAETAGEESRGETAGTDLPHRMYY